MSPGGPGGLHSNLFSKVLLSWGDREDELTGDGGQTLVISFPLSQDGGAFD